MLKSVGNAKLGVVKVVKESMGIGLKEAKEFVDSAPCTIADFVKMDQAWELKKIIENEGGVVNMVSQPADKAIEKANSHYANGKYGEALEL